MPATPWIVHPHFALGDLIQHRLFDYRGVVVDVDARFDLSDELYEAVARTRPPKDQPWYRVLVDGADQATYVAERNLVADESGAPVDHPWLEQLFAGFENGRYVPCERGN